MVDTNKWKDQVLRYDLSGESMPNKASFPSPFECLVL